MALFVRRLWLMGLCALPVLTADVASPSNNCVNTPTTRDCWKDGFTIHDDYTKLEAPEGKLVEYDWVVSQQIISPDGYEKLGMVINGQYPGPTLEADWGDTIRVTIHNNLTNFNGTAFHWHGIRQYQTNWLDGVPGVTQCPIAPGESQTYEFKAYQYGTSWYHSHFSLQYSNGLYGPIVIHGPSSMNYDIDLGPWLLSDWYHADVFSLDHIGITTNRAAIPDSSVINGKGFYDCDPASDDRCTGKREWFEVVLEEKKSYKFAIANTGTLLTYTFWIDGHNFTVIQNDFVPIEPFVTDTLNVGIGQRYEIVINADATFEHGPNFWMHAQYCVQGETNILDSKVGIVRYDATNTSDPYLPPTSDYHTNFGCADPSPENLVPIVKQRVGPRANPMIEKDYLKIGRGNFTWPDTPAGEKPVFLWVLQDLPQYVRWDDPSVKKLTLDDDSSFPPDAVPIYLDYEEGEWVYFVITAAFDTAAELDELGEPITRPPSVHPMHLHGHDFVILAQGSGPFTSDVKPNLDNPPRRDVVDMDLNGYLWIAFQVDNPGAWLLHCHIAFHSSDGVSVQFIEMGDKLKPLMDEAGVLGQLGDQCDTWTNYYETVNIPNNATQADSGI